MKFHSIRSKIIFLSSLCLLITGTTIIAYAVIYVRDSAILRANDQIRYIARDRADHVQLELDKAMTNLHTLALIMCKVKDPLDPLNIEREQVDILLQSVLNQNKNIVGAYTCWLPDAFDNKDKYYENEPGHDKTGRFSPYWYRNKYGIIDVEPFRHYDEGGAGNFLLVYKEIRQPFVADPHVHTIDGNDFLVVSLIVPVILKENFYGIVGIDLGFNALQNLTDKTGIEKKGGLITILSDDGKIVGATGRQDLAGEDAYKIVEDIDQYNGEIDKGEKFTGYSKGNIEFFAPIKIANSNPWWVIVSMPKKIITAEARDLSKQLIFVGMGCIIVSIFIFWLFSSSIVKPVNSLVKSVRQIGQGKYGQVIEDVESQDEIGELASEFNNMSIEVKNREVERDKAQDLLRLERDNLRNIFESIEDGVYIVNQQYDIQYVNPVLVKDFGPYEGIKCYRYFHDRDEICPWCKNKDVQAGKTVRWEWYSSKNGKTYDMLDTPITLPDGSTGKLEIFRDITERKQAEEELKKYRDHLEELVEKRTEELKEKTDKIEESRNALTYLVEDVNEAREELEKTNERLKELDRLKSMFIASMSHELRTPLNSIIGFTGIILQGMTGEINPEQKDQLQRVYGSAKHLLALINDVIDISKIEAGKFEVHTEEFSLDGVIEEAVSSLKPEMDNKGLDLEISLPSDTQLTTDRKRLLQCILNHLSNAVKFTEKGEIEIAAHEVDGMMEIRVKDTGIGIKEEDIPSLFESFVRLDTPLKITTTGTGLGLYLTKKIATEMLKGSVSVESTYGEGSTFVLRIPKEIA
ncbi:MAG: ATP-binding protein [Thermodesulfobacteriota bacterium]|nr:ATP-binding protein [Thermodesulfobacteriota bacterium]